MNFDKTRTNFINIKEAFNSYIERNRFIYIDFLRGNLHNYMIKRVYYTRKYYKAVPFDIKFYKNFIKNKFFIN